MPDTATLLPARRLELLVSPLGDNGQCVVKDPRTGAYFHLGEQEAFLLGQLDGEQAAAAVCASFDQRFGQPLSEADLCELIEFARTRHSVRPGDSAAQTSAGRA